MIFLKRFTVVLCLLAVLFCSCGGTADESMIASFLEDAIGIEVKRSDISADDAYMIFLDENEYPTLVESAAVLRESAGLEGYEAIVIVAKNEDAADKIAEKISRLYWWAPCDIAERMICANLGRTVFAVKGSDGSVEKAYRAYCGIYGAKNCETRQKVQ